MLVHLSSTKPPYPVKLGQFRLILIRRSGRYPAAAKLGSGTPGICRRREDCAGDERRRPGRRTIRMRWALDAHGRVLLTEKLAHQNREGIPERTVHTLLDQTPGTGASGQNQTDGTDSRASHRDCFVAPLLAMTAFWWSLRAKRSNLRTAGRYQTSDPYHSHVRLSK